MTMNRDTHPPTLPRLLLRRDVLALASAALMTATAVAAPAPQAPDTAGPLANFLTASTRLTGFAQLPTDFGKRIWNGLVANAGQRSDLERLVRIVTAAPAGADLTAELASNGLQAICA